MHIAKFKILHIAICVWPLTVYCAFYMVLLNAIVLIKGYFNDNSAVISCKCLKPLRHEELGNHLFVAPQFKVYN